MKNLIKSIAMATAASGFLLASSAMAAEQKIGVVNFQEVMGKIPQTAAIMKSLGEEFKDEQAVLSQLETEIKYLQEKRKRDGSLMSAKDIADLEAKIGTLYQDYQAKGKAFQEKTGARKNEETNKIIALVRQAIDNIAAKGDYDLVLEQSAVVYSKPDSAITAEVVKQVSVLK
ncbi:OmpH family outer membrane protein [Colwellia sp. MB02u-10]|uniref:OmpH family outer membrane protein n=1 Tax=Colwellia sp. MB02u-10 TaxID=2759828 RepID=UPI0015F5F914|nr:OmpH family outer membrane protein [Colwellia sp. MB02u-10]MBA6341347.1 OmpH family outer membrane protein [Colwellia sp. MB02u-10]